MAAENQNLGMFDYVLEHVNNISYITKEITNEDLDLTWFCYILGGWKALVSSSALPDLYFEVTYSKSKDEVYVDTYQKVDNVAYSKED